MSFLQYLSIIYLLPFLILLSANVEKTDSDVKNKSGDNESEKQNTGQLFLYRKVFKQKRVEQMIAVEKILKMKDYAQQYKIIKIIFENLFKVLQDAKLNVVSSGYVPGEEFPVEHKYKEAIGNIVENTALLGDIVLRLPDIAHKIFTKEKDWKLLTLWSLSFTNSTTIYDEMDTKLLNLMAQELKLIPREKNYFNPFTEEAKRLTITKLIADNEDLTNVISHLNRELQNELGKSLKPYYCHWLYYSREKIKEKEAVLTQKTKKAEKKKKSKGPRLSHIEL